MVRLIDIAKKTGFSVAVVSRALQQEKDPYDRKIWFAVLVVVTIISYFVPAGIVI